MRARYTILAALLLLGALLTTLPSCGGKAELKEPVSDEAPDTTATEPVSDTTVPAPAPEVHVSKEEPSVAKALPPVPPPMLDGLIGESEWNDTSRYKAGWDEGRIWIRQYLTYVYICIAPADTGHTGLNLYVEDANGQVFMLHSSYAHGQRQLSGDNWEEMRWGPAGLWTSNLVQSVIRNGRRVYIMPEAFEFQISRQLLPEGKFKFVLHFERPERWIPENADTLLTDNWFWYTGQADAGS
jgi:hypothetical protein